MLRCGRVKPRTGERNSTRFEPQAGRNALGCGSETQNDGAIVNEIDGDFFVAEWLADGRFHFAEDSGRQSFGRYWASASVKSLEKESKRN